MPSLRTNLVMNLAANLILAAALCLISGSLVSCAQQSSVLSQSAKDYTVLSGKLAKDMTEKAVADAIGTAPDKADLTTCTDHAGKQWQCRSWIFAGGTKPNNNLRVVFYEADDGSWRVAAWDMF
jgi:hypothetical protein